MSRPEEPGGLGLTGTTGGGLERTGVLSGRKKHGYPSHKSDSYELTGENHDRPLRNALKRRCENGSKRETS